MSDLESLQAEMSLIEEKLTDAAASRKKLIESLYSTQQKSAVNLIQYLAMRNEDVRSLQDDLHKAGLSSMASAESHILKQVQSIRQRLGATIKEKDISNCTHITAEQLLSKRATDLFGFKKNEAIPHIMVTLDASFEDDVNLVKRLLEAGMNIARINSAHGNEKSWSAIIATVRKASDKCGRPCNIYMDIAGPKMRVELPRKGKKEGKLHIKPGQEILLVENGEKIKSKTSAIACHEKGVFSGLKAGERIIIDDGKFEGIVKKRKKHTYLRITRISSRKSVLKKDKGINLPDTVLDLAPLTASDLKALPFIAFNADLVGCSFLRNAYDVKFIRETFSLYKKSPRLILKIETPEAVINLPSLLLEAMAEETFGVMIARGDLAVEIGFERLSEIQDEILWICEAAHAPVIWATQVLETFNKSGIATRSEVTDAAHSAKAECVMLNKGAYIVETINTLKGILKRSGQHRHKKRYSMRPLNIATHFLKETAPVKRIIQSRMADLETVAN